MGNFFFQKTYFLLKIPNLRSKKSTTYIFDPENRLFHTKFLPPPVRHFLGSDFILHVAFHICNVNFDVAFGRCIIAILQRQTRRCKKVDWLQSWFCIVNHGVAKKLIGCKVSFATWNVTLQKCWLVAKSILQRQTRRCKKDDWLQSWFCIVKHDVAKK